MVVTLSLADLGAIDIPSGRGAVTSKGGGARRSSDQRELTQYILPASVNVRALKQLQCMNVTAFSFFGSTECRMETLAYQEIEGQYEVA